MFLYRPLLQRHQNCYPRKSKRRAGICPGVLTGGDPQQLDAIRASTPAVTLLIDVGFPVQHAQMAQKLGNSNYWNKLTKFILD